MFIINIYKETVAAVSAPLRKGVYSNGIDYILVCSRKCFTPPNLKIYSEKSDCFIVADIENNNVYLHSVLYKNYIPLCLKNLHTFLDKAKKFGKFQI